MCYKKDTDPITTDLSFCAVAEHDCTDGYDFMPAYELNNMDSPPRTCRLCTMKDLEEYSLHKSVVVSGRCVSDDGEYGLCALESTDCNDSENETFQSSIQIILQGGSPCRSNAFSGGQCTNADVGEVHCTNYKDACVTPSAFFKLSTCMIYSDKASTNDEPMYFGECKKKQDSTGSDEREYRCVWHSSECDEEEEEWTPASKPMDWYDGCKCEDVETGACRDTTGLYYCAVSSDACAVDHTYIPSLEIKEKGIDCRLCQRSRIAKNPTTSPSNNPSKKITYYPTLSTLPPEVRTDPPTENDSFIPTTAAYKAITFDDDDDYDDYDDDMSDDNDTLSYDEDYDYDYDDDDMSDEKGDSQRTFDVILILSGSIGGTLFFTCVGIFFYYRDPLPIKLYMTDNEVAVKGDVV